MINLIVQILVAALLVVPSITLHEAAHGYAALALGDDTAKQMGRLSLNPLRHVDRFGTILLPGFLIVSQLLTLGHIEFLFGWAKPVPVDARRFPDPRRDMALVAIAGPAMNFFLAWLGALSLHLASVLPAADVPYLVEGAGAFMTVNLALGLFNLIPLPPLDGGRIMVGVLPLPLAILWARIERFGLLIMVLLLFVLPIASQSMGHRIDPLADGAARVIPNAQNLMLKLAFIDDQRPG
jgi:Zn-dependent protease